jgi:RNAse (barnase) inhibitor barstar
MQVLIRGWMLVDGDLSYPVPGEVLSGLALRLSSDSSYPEQQAVVVEGTIRWANFDPNALRYVPLPRSQRGNGVMETVVEATGFKVLTYEECSAEEPVPEVGARARREGYLSSAALYEFEAFGLPDVSQNWLVLSVRELTPPDDLLVELEPVEERSSLDASLPVLIIDGVNFHDFDGFVREFSSQLVDFSWNGNLDAFNDILRGGCGTPSGGLQIRWFNSRISREVLGWKEMALWLERTSTTRHASNIPVITERLEAARRHEGQTLFDWIVEIIDDHGPGGRESADNIHLRLL